MRTAELSSWLSVISAVNTAASLTQKSAKSGSFSQNAICVTSFCMPQRRPSIEELHATVAQLTRCLSVDRGEDLHARLERVRTGPGVALLRAMVR